MRHLNLSLTTWVNKMIILQGIVGSMAYGLNTENSNIDRLGVFINSTASYWRLTKPKETIVKTSPDIRFHEIEKFLSLCLKCNPTLMELLWLEKYEFGTSWGNELVYLRDAFLSTRRIITAYAGYASSQIKNGNKDAFKRAKHCLRLIRQGKELLTTGFLTIRVKNPEEYFALEKLDAAHIEDKLINELDDFICCKSVLPNVPDIDRINEFLSDVRSNN